MGDTEAFLGLVHSKNVSVYDFQKRRFAPIIDVNKVRNKIWWYRFWHEPAPGLHWYRSLHEWCVDNGLIRYVGMLKTVILIVFLLLCMRWLPGESQVRTEV